MDDYSNPHAIHNANTPAFASIGDAIGNFGNKQIINNVAAASASGGKRTRKRKHMKKMKSKKRKTKKMKPKKRQRGGYCSACSSGITTLGGGRVRRKVCHCGCHSGKICRVRNCQCICHKFMQGGTTSPTQASAPYSIPGTSLKASELGLANPPPIYSSNPFLKL